MSPVQLTKYFAYLDKLRASGATNMFRASEFVQKNYACGKSEAEKVTHLWMKTFDEAAKLSERVKAALEQQPRNREDA